MQGKRQYFKPMGPMNMNVLSKPCGGGKGRGGLSNENECGDNCESAHSKGGSKGCIQRGERSREKTVSGLKATG